MSELIVSEFVCFPSRSGEIGAQVRHVSDFAIRQSIVIETGRLIHHCERFPSCLCLRRGEGWMNKAFHEDVEAENWARRLTSSVIGYLILSFLTQNIVSCTIIVIRYDYNCFYSHIENASHGNTINTGEEISLYCQRHHQQWHSKTPNECA